MSDDATIDRLIEQFVEVLGSSELDGDRHVEFLVAALGEWSYAVGQTPQEWASFKVELISRL